MSDEKMTDNILSNIKGENILPKIYAILLGNNNQEYLGICVAYSLEDAILSVKREAHSGAQMDVRITRTNLWSILSMEDLKKKIFQTEVILQTAEPPDSRIMTDASFVNSVMREIVDKKDLDLYDKIKHNFNKNERQYLENKLNYVANKTAGTRKRGSRK